MNMFSSDAHTNRPARPQTTTRPEAYQFSPAHPELPGQLLLREYVEDLVETRTQLADCFSIWLRLLERLKLRHLHIEDAPAFTAAQSDLVANHIQLPDGHGDGMGA